MTMVNIYLGQHCCRCRSGVASRCQRAIEGRRQARLGPRNVVEGRLQRTAKIRAHQFVEPAGGISPFARAEETKPFGANSDMTLLVVVDDVEYRRTLQVSS